MIEVEAIGVDLILLQMKPLVDNVNCVGALGMVIE